MAHCVEKDFKSPIKSRATIYRSKVETCLNEKCVACLLAKWTQSARLGQELHRPDAPALRPGKEFKEVNVL